VTTVEERVAFLEGRVEEQSQMVTGIREAIVNLEQRMDRRFEAVESRLAGLDQKLDQRVAELDQKLGGLDQKLDQRIAGLDQRFARLVGLQVTTLLAMVTTLVATVAALLVR
jgi:uncharacterized coiled-coil protein SlyX